MANQNQKLPKEGQQGVSAEAPTGAKEEGGSEPSNPEPETPAESTPISKPSGTPKPLADDPEDIFASPPLQSPSEASPPETETPSAPLSPEPPQSPKESYSDRPPLSEQTPTTPVPSEVEGPLESTEKQSLFTPPQEPLTSPETPKVPEAITPPLEPIAPRSSEEPLVEQIRGPSEVPPEAGSSAAETLSLETPELNKKEIIKEAHDEGVTPEEEEKIQVMPEKFKKMKPKLPGKKASKKTLILAGIIILLVIFGGAGFYLWTHGYFHKPAKVVGPSEEPAETIVEEAPTEEPVEEPVEEQVEPALSAEQTLTAILKDETEKITITSAQFYLPEGALDPGIELELTGAAVTDELKAQEVYTESSYDILGALYTFSSADFVLNKAGKLSISYDESLVEEKWEEYIVLGYLKDDLWTSLPSTIDIENNTAVIELEIFPSDTFAIMVSKDKLAPKAEEFKIGKNIPPSVDSDNDGLTDIEEYIFSLEVNNPDSDADGNPDGQEIIGLMHPLSADEDKLAMSGLVNVYTNPTYSYSFFYPSTWLARALPDTDNQEVLIITNTGEFFSATVDNNPEMLSMVDWYLKQSPQTDKSLLYETIVNNQSAVWNPSRLTIYIAKDDRVYMLSYSVGIEKESNFKTTFEMIINSFQFVVQSKGRADGTLIKYLDKPEVYLVESGKKRAFQSGEIFEKLGFSWEDVIEIQLSETYVDGDPVTGRLDGTLIKYPDSSGIYLVESGKKRAFQSGELFEALGFKWEDVIEIPVDEIYPDGPIIESSITSTPSVE